MNTRKELYEYINKTYGKKAGEYTLDEYYQIGIQHRKLPRSQKNWQELTSYVGYPGEAEQYRLATLRYLKGSDISMRIHDKDEIIENSDMYADLYKEKVQIRDIYNSYRANLRKEAREDNFKELIYQALKDVKPFNFTHHEVPIVKKGNEAILLLSDLHIGVDCNNFYNKFNSNVAKDRLNLLLDKTLSYCKLFNVTQLNVCNLGDMIQGIIHTSARIEAEKDVVNQVKIAAELIATFVAELAERSNMRIVYRSCTDNHSRVTPNLSESLESENLSRLIDWYLEARLQLNKAPIIFANDNIDISIGKFDLLNGKKVMFAHGHLDTINKCVDNFVSATHEYIDYVLLAHYHNAKEKAYGSSKVFVNGGLVGTEQYALSKRLFGIAEQKLLIFSDADVVDLSINLQDA